ncbi:MAG: 23S rRNA (pseudouridine(1915)-N(3))-methyltransferase RlmH [Candidatus Izemoplasmatales bacterium]|jgi:23S rRNA (pseudouridine1915-N3)-methyltransferase|nr:23S rRNA (pseudouridine(1915)-N(3))-methyltransferase RlmH [Candidatus Izemoplasmatales bacterium]MDD4988060.1 23S rRNA (pseudouridine(1915)-N(3))-methyltransferase RlmH [Candidatus Izemoplasmatales bacterium]MDD5602404.1 23S rRNA (pseudouridine(1915)-N(3))-methyltransferase RlmH [Candidatus Izemoplasmatales bacterium]MDY0373968.1 23S rRNA (pseudouridine(1915)-N(3))-methyltransferase RlmH [Candidatus Izemoplasmatales bacterium]NLF48910.1 23S rRNA (pseudouridine(1915)-N(3))-methyltransferase 
MKKLWILSVGTIKETYLTSGIAEYAKRLKPYFDLEIVEVAEETCKKKPSEGDILQIQAEEGKRLLAKIPDRAWIYVLDQEGTQLTSLEFSSLLEKSLTYQNEAIAFVIGGSWGLSQAVKERAKSRLSFSRLTFPHQLMRLIFLEQLYRAVSIIHNSDYHK